MASGFIWYELMTTDTDGAVAFYRDVVGWTAKPWADPNMSYTILEAGTRGIGGVMALPEHVRAGGGRPGWLGYVGVVDADAATDAVRSAGGSVHRPPSDIPDVGRFSVVSDPQGATFQLLAPTARDAPPALSPDTPGLIGWHELYAADWEAAFDFYAGLFGWTKGDAIDMGPMGVYQLFTATPHVMGGMMNKPEPERPPGWLFYFNVENIQAAAERVKSAGGQVVTGPHEVPGGSWILQGMDPQGASFALVAAPR